MLATDDQLTTKTHQDATRDEDSTFSNPRMYFHYFNIGHKFRNFIPNQYLHEIIRFGNLGSVAGK